MAELVCINPKQIDMFWARVEPLLAQAMDYSNFDTTNDLLSELKQEKALLWIVHTGTEIDATLVTQIKKDKRGKLLSIWALAGRDMSQWLSLHSEIVAFAKAEGCNRLIHELRPGFARVLTKKLGYRMTHATVQKEI